MAARVKKMKPKGAIADLQKGLGGVFDTLRCMEKDDRNVENSHILLEKFVGYNTHIRDIITHLIKLDQKLLSVGIMVQKMPELNKTLVGGLKKYHFDTRRFEQSLDLLSMPVDDLVKMKNSYLALQDSDFFDMVLKVHKNILVSRISKLSYLEFIKRCATDDADIFLTNGMTIEESALFAQRAKSSNLVDNICTIWNLGDLSSTIPPDVKEDIYCMLKQVTVSGKALYDERKKPDIDVEKIFEVLMKYLKSMRKDMPGCDRAIDIIEKSSHMFKTNYANYYKSMIHSGNPISMIDEFTCDVIKNSADSNMKDLLQLRKFSRHMKKLISKNVVGPMPQQAKDMMSKIETYFDAILETQSDDAGADVESLNAEFERLLSK